MSKIEAGQQYKSNRGTIIEIVSPLDNECGLVKFIILNPTDREEMFVDPDEDMLSSNNFRVINGIVKFQLIADFISVGAAIFEMDSPPIDMKEKGIIIAVSDRECVVDYGKDGSGFVVYERHNFDKLKPYPLCWIEDVPIYIGTTLYYKTDGEECVVESYIPLSDGTGWRLQVNSKCAGVCHETLETLTPIAPKKPVKVVKWVNVYSNDTETWTSRLYDSREDAYNKRSNQNYVATSSIEWEQ